MKKILGISFCFILWGICPLWAQEYFLDALRFSQTLPNGSARYLGVAGAQTGLGADVSNITNNPAGLGMFNKSEFSFTPVFNAANTQTSYLGNNTNDNKSALSIGNMGLVIFAGKDPIEQSKWRGGSFGISVSRTNNFQNVFSYAGINTQTSKTDFMVDRAWGIPVSEFTDFEGDNLEYERTAYYANLINPFTNNNPNESRYFTFFRDENERLLGDIRQSDVVTTTGGQNQIDFAYGGNYSDKVYFGISGGLRTLNYTQRTNYSEEINSEVSFLDSFTEANDYRVRGTGFGATVGLMLRPVSFWRIGATFTTPTWYSLREEFSTTFTAKVYDSNNILRTTTQSTIPGSYNYRLTTPWRASFGTAVFMGKYGFISADAEYVPFNTARLADRDNANVFTSDNRFIDNNFARVWSLRAGAEMRLSHFRIRGGYSYQPSPVQAVDRGISIDRSVRQISGGLGIRLVDFYLDLAVIRTQFNTVYTPYAFDDDSPYAGLSPYVAIKNVFMQSMISFGFYF